MRIEDSLKGISGFLFLSNTKVRCIDFLLPIVSLCLNVFAEGKTVSTAKLVCARKKIVSLPIQLSSFSMSAAPAVLCEASLR